MHAVVVPDAFEVILGEFLVAVLVERFPVSIVKTYIVEKPQAIRAFAGCLAFSRPEFWHVIRVILEPLASTFRIE